MHEIHARDAYYNVNIQFLVSMESKASDGCAEAAVPCSLPVFPGVGTAAAVVRTALRRLSGVY